MESQKTEQEWVDERPRNGTVWVSHVALGDKCQATGKRGGRQWAGRGAPCHGATKSGVNACRLNASPLLQGGLLHRASLREARTSFRSWLTVV